MIYHRRINESYMDYEERLYRNQSMYNLSWSEINKLLNLNQHPDTTRKASYGYLRRVDQERRHNFDKAIMIINDLHLPFEREDVLEIINKHKAEITALVIGGDFMDCKSISKFPQIKTMRIEDELIYAYNFLKKIRKILNKNQKIIIIDGNHEERWYKDICKMQEKDMQKFINPKIISMLIDGFTIYNEGEKKIYDGIDNVIHIPHWFVNIDKKVIVCHPKNFSAVKGKMLENSVQHFVNRNEIFDVLVLGHTHKYSNGIVDRYQGKFAIENGCLCQPQPYADSGKLSYTPQSCCYTIIKYNDNEPVDYNNIKTYFLTNNLNEKSNFQINSTEKYYVSTNERGVI